MHRLIASLAVVTTALAALAASAAADVQRAASGPVVAELTFQSSGATGGDDPRLVVTRAAQQVLDTPIKDKACMGPCAIATFRDAVTVRDLDGDGEVEVLVDAFTGGAHCCFLSHVLRWTGTSYTTIRHNWGDPVYRLVDLNADNRSELLSADPRFAYRFASFAGTKFPVQIFALRTGRLVNVTREHPARIRTDARKWWRAYLQQRRRALNEPLGALAAWAADEYLLGRRAATLRTLRGLARRSLLRAPRGYPSGRRFISDLDGFLTRTGYRRR